MNMSDLPGPLDTFYIYKLVLEIETEIKHLQTRLANCAYIISRHHHDDKYNVCNKKYKIVLILNRYLNVC